jgi:heme/copper-type cytochrome/quinol oxidase subunit 4
MRLSTSPRLKALLTSHAAVFLLYTLLTLPFLLLQDLTILHSDDWMFLNAMIRDQLPWVDAYQSRMFFHGYWRLMHCLFSTNLTAGYVFIWAAQTWFSYSVYRSICYLKPDWRLLAVVAGLLVLFAPGNHTREWWTMGHPWLSFGLLFGSFLLCASRYLRSHGTLSLWCAALGLPLSFGFFEMHMGVAALVILLIAIHLRRSNPEQLRLFAVIPLIFVAYILLHYARLSVLDVHANRVAAITPDAAILLARFSKAAMILIKVWGAPLVSMLGLTSATSTAFMLLSTVTAFGVGIRIAKLLPPDKETAKSNTPDHRKLRPIITGLIAAIPLALVPVILVMPPSSIDVDSRTIMAASPVVALLVGTCLLALTSFFGITNQRGQTLAVGIGILPLILVGGLERIVRIEAHHEVWNTQQRMWHVITDQIPVIRSHTYVLLLVERENNFSRPTSRAMFGGRTGLLTGAVQLLYDDATLEGAVITSDWYDDRRYASSTASDIPEPLIAPLPIERTLVMQYDVPTACMHVLSRPELEKRWGLALPAYNPYTRIDTNGVNTSPWRSLIE